MHLMILVQSLVTHWAAFQGQTIAWPGLTRQVCPLSCSADIAGTFGPFYALAMLSKESTDSTSLRVKSEGPWRAFLCLLLPAGEIINMRISAHDAYGLKKYDEDEDRDLQCKLWYTSDSFGNVGVNNIQPWVGELTPVRLRAWLDGRLESHG